MRMNDNEEGGVDMCKKFLVLALMLGLASAAYAGEVTTQFGGDGNWEGFGSAWGSEFPPSAVQPDGSLKVTVSQGGYWGMQYVGAPVDMVGALRMEMDVTYIASEWIVLDEFGEPIPTPGIYVQMDAVAIQPGWNQRNNTAINLATGLTHSKAWGPAEGDMTLRYTWDMSTVALPSSSEIYFAMQCDQDLSVPLPAIGSFYLDRAVMVTPEPATIGMLGLGGLALIRRKK
jgi:hypothetical protein